jgi:hypothetical protein
MSFYREQEIIYRGLRDEIVDCVSLNIEHRGAFGEKRKGLAPIIGGGLRKLLQV